MWIIVWIFTYLYWRILFCFHNVNHECLFKLADDDDRGQWWWQHNKNKMHASIKLIGLFQISISHSATHLYFLLVEKANTNKNYSPMLTSTILGIRKNIFSLTMSQSNQSINNLVSLHKHIQYHFTRKLVEETYNLQWGK